MKVFVGFIVGLILCGAIGGATVYLTGYGADNWQFWAIIIPLVSAIVYYEDRLVKYLIMFFVHLRWAYFHLNPAYMKFTMSSESNEAHFQHKKHGTIHSNLVWKDIDDE